MRELLPEDSRTKWLAGGLADRPLDLNDIMQRAQHMTAAMAANKLLVEVLTELDVPVHSRLLDNIDACFAFGILNRHERDNLRKINTLANKARFVF